MHEVDVVVLGGSVLASALAEQMSHAGLRVAVVAPKDWSGGLKASTFGMIDSGLSDSLSWRLLRLFKKRTYPKYWSNAAKHLVHVYPLTCHAISSTQTNTPSRGWAVKLKYALYRLISSQAIWRNFSKKDIAGFSSQMGRAPLNSLPEKVKTAHKKHLEGFLDADRLSVLWAASARAQGAMVFNYANITELHSGSEGWQISYQLLNDLDQNTHQIKAPFLINTLTYDEALRVPAIDQLLDRSQWQFCERRYVVVPKPTEAAYTLVQPQQQPHYVMPVSSRAFCVGVSTRQFSLAGEYESAVDTAALVQQTCDLYGQMLNANASLVLPALNANEVSSTHTEVSPSFKKRLRATDSAHQWSMVGSAAVIWPKLGEHKTAEHASVIHVQGGELSDLYGMLQKTWQVLHQQATLVQTEMARSVANKIQQISVDNLFEKPVLGSDFSGSTKDYMEWLIKRKSWISFAQRERLIKTYGTQVYHFLGDAAAHTDLGPVLVGGISASEINYLRQHEMALSAEDILFRRTKVGFELTKEQQQQAITDINEWLKTH